MSVRSTGATALDKLLDDAELLRRDFVGPHRVVVHAVGRHASALQLVVQGVVQGDDEEVLDAELLDAVDELEDAGRVDVGHRGQHLAIDGDFA